MNTSEMTLPWLLPDVAVALALSAVLSGAAGRALSVRRIVAWVLLVSSESSSRRP